MAYSFVKWRNKIESDQKKLAKSVNISFENDTRVFKKLEDICCWYCKCWVWIYFIPSLQLVLDLYYFEVVVVNKRRLYACFINVCFDCSGASIKVVFETAVNTIVLSGSAAAVDAALKYVQSKFVDTICHDSLHLFLPGNWSYFNFLYVNFFISLAVNYSCYASYCFQ